MKQLLITICTLLPCLSIAQENPYRIYDTRLQHETSITDIVQTFGEADVLFFGEDHGDSIGHVLELQLLEASFRAYGQSLILSLEMFETDVQLVLDEYTGGIIREKNLMKDARPWKNYQDYRPLVEFARENGIRVIAANAPSRYTNAVTANGLEILNQLDRRGKAFLPPLPIDTATGRYYEKFQEILGGHGAMSGMQLYQSQNLWDATMAWSVYNALRAQRGSKILHINGRFHTDEKLGIPAQLMRYAAKDKKNKIRILNISSFPEPAYRTAVWETYEALGDFIILTAPREKEEQAAGGN